MGRGSAEWFHLFIEAKKLAFADRAKFYADPAFGKLPIAELISKRMPPSGPSGSTCTRPPPTCRRAIRCCSTATRSI